MTARRDETRSGLLLMIPAAAALILFTYYPIAQTLIYSFFDLDLTTDWLSADFIGLRNYLDVMQSNQFWYTFAFTLGFTVVTVLIDLALGMLFALASFYVVPRMRGILRSVLIIPWAIPEVIQASMWRWMLNSDVGPVGDILVRTGLVQEPPLFLVDQALAMGSIVFAYSWKGASITAFFLMGGLALIPSSVIESAKVDGAGALRRFFSITLPMVMPTVFVAVMYRSRSAIRVFDIVYGLTGGGPGNATDTMSSFAYKYYFQFTQFGRGSAYAVVTFLLVAAVSVYYIWQVKHRFQYRD